MPRHLAFVALLAASLLGFQASTASAKPAPRPTQKPAAAPAPKPPVRPAGKVITPTPGPRMQESGDALVEPAGSTPELQGDQQFTNTINWTRREIIVLGIGIAPDRGTLATRRTLARSYALEDGLRQMAEVVDKVRVNADAHVRDLTVADDEARTKVNQRIRAAKIIDTNTLPDGSVELKLKMDLFGKEGLAGALLKEASPIAYASSATPSLPTSAYSGIILDARGTGAQPALEPSIRPAEGKPLDVDNVTGERGGRPKVAYVHTREGANDTAGDNPFYSKVKRAAGLINKTDLVLDNADFRKIKDALLGAGLTIVIII